MEKWWRSAIKRWILCSFQTDDESSQILTQETRADDVIVTSSETTPEFVTSLNKDDCRNTDSVSSSEDHHCEKECDRQDEPPYIPECEVFEEGGPEAEQRAQSCGCNRKFIPMNKLKLTLLNTEHFKKYCARTVKLSVKYTSENRPDTYPNSTAPYPYAKYKGSHRVSRCGTGLIYVDEPIMVTDEVCPCPDCKTSKKPKKKYFSVKVSTAAHVVFDDSEAERTICDVFYDCENRDGVRFLYGIKGVDRYLRGTYDCYYIGGCSERSNHDLFFMDCVSHDVAFYELLKSSIDMRSLRAMKWCDMCIVVSHPHGWSKQVSFGTYRHYMLQFSKAHSTDHPYIFDDQIKIVFKNGLDSHYRGFFKKVRNTDNWYCLTQPLKVYITCDLQQTALVYSSEGRYVALPKTCKMTSMDGQTEFPVEAFSFHVYDLLVIFKDNLISYHLIYDIPTCNGSSGAHVITPFHSAQFLPCHFGKLANGVNRSGSYSSIE